MSKISNLSDARYCAGMGVEMLGFRVIPGNEDYMPPELFQDIRGWISGPKVIAELYGVTHRNEIDLAVQTYAPDYFELTYNEYKDFRDFLSLPCIIYLPMGMHAGLIKDDEKISYMIVDEQTRCTDMTIRYPALIKIGTVEKLNEKLSEGCFKGFVLDGPKQSRPGVTHYAQLGEILEALDED